MRLTFTPVRYRKEQQKGSMLIEMLVAVGLLGIMTASMAPLFGDVVTMSERAYAEKHKLNNILIGNSLLNAAATHPKGSLPEPKNNSTFFLRNGVIDFSDNSNESLNLQNQLMQAGLSLSEVNDDGKTVRNQRVYQRVDGIETVMPMNFSSGPQIHLTFDVGVIYMTKCPINTSSCLNSTGIPGDSSEITKSNYKTWNVSGTDFDPYFISTLPIQKMMLTTTVNRLNTVRDALISYFRAMQLNASASDRSNWYLNELGQSAPGSKAGIDPNSNQGCRDGWYSLKVANLILPSVGLSSEEYGQTPWGGSIEYCRDYDLAATGQPNEAPHYGALRFNKDLTKGDPPNALTSNNVVMAF